MLTDKENQGIGTIEQGIYISFLLAGVLGEHNI
jgi:hypothetical protein